MKRFGLTCLVLMILSFSWAITPAAAQTPECVDLFHPRLVIYPPFTNGGVKVSNLVPEGQVGCTHFLEVASFWLLDDNDPLLYERSGRSIAPNETVNMDTPLPDCNTVLVFLIDNVVVQALEDSERGDCPPQFEPQCDSLSFLEVKVTSLANNLVQATFYNKSLYCPYPIGVASYQANGKLYAASTDQLAAGEHMSILLPMGDGSAYFYSGRTVLDLNDDDYFERQVQPVTGITPPPVG